MRVLEKNKSGSTGHQADHDEPLNAVAADLVAFLSGPVETPLEGGAVPVPDEYDVPLLSASLAIVILRGTNKSTEYAPRART